MKKFAIHVIKNSEHYYCFDEVVEILFYGLKELNYDAIITDDLTLTNYQYIVFGVNTLYQNHINLPENTIIYNLEQIYNDSPWLKAGYIDYLLQYPLWDYSLTNIQQLQRFGVNKIQYLPIGYVNSLTKIVHKKDKDIDILFYGSINERRAKIIDRLEKEGVKIKTLFGVYGKERDNYIAKSKIVLNMHFYQSQVFEIVRVSYLLANRVFVISETSNNSEEQNSFQQGLVFAEYTNLVSSCLDFLDRDKDRETIANQGFKIMKNRQEKDYLKPVLEDLINLNYSPTKFKKDFFRKNLAKKYFYQEKYEKTVLLYQESLQVDRDDLESYIYLALTLLYLDDILTAQFMLGEGINQLEITGINSEIIINQISDILTIEINRQLSLNNIELAQKIEQNFLS